MSILVENLKMRLGGWQLRLNELLILGVHLTMKLLVYTKAQLWLDNENYEYLIQKETKLNSYHLQISDVLPLKALPEKEV
jgi:hypothetical protein